jgi:hypothetical protein
MAVGSGHGRAGLNFDRFKAGHEAEVEAFQRCSETGVVQKNGKPSHFPIRDRRSEVFELCAVVAPSRPVYNPFLLDHDSCNGSALARPVGAAKSRRLSHEQRASLLGRVIDPITHKLKARTPARYADAVAFRSSES